MGGFLRDCRFALRVLWRRKFVFWSSVFVLASGMAVNVSFFSIVNAVLLRPFPVPNPDELIYVRQLLKTGRISSMYGFDEYAAQRYRVAGHALLTSHWTVRYPLNVEGGDLVSGEAVDWNYFSTLGLAAERGRLFSEQDQTDPNTVVISSLLWHRYWRGDTEIVGKTVALGGKTRTIIGVAPAEFVGISDPWSPSRFWIPLAGWRTNYRTVGLSIFGRLRPGTSAAQLSAELSSLQRAASPDGLPRYVVDVATPLGPLPFDSTGTVLPRRLAVGLLVLGFLVLIVAGSNVGGLLLSAGLERTSEFAVRSTLGATPFALARQLVAEGLMLSSIALFVGLGGGVLLVQAFLGLMPSRFAFPVPLDHSVLRFAMVQAVIVGLSCSAWPVWRLSRRRSGIALRDQMPTGSSSRLWHGSVAAGLQIAVSLSVVTLCISAGVALSRAENRDVGYTLSNIHVANAFLRWQGERSGPEAIKQYGESQRRFAARLLEAASADPSVARAAVADGLPLQLPPTASVFDRHAVVTPDAPQGFLTSISPDYFSLFDIEILRGRGFGTDDRYGGTAVAVVTESLADRLWTQETAVGQSLTVQSPGTGPRRVEVVGVSRNVSPVIGSANGVGVYIPVDQTEAFGGQYLLARSRSSSDAVDLRSIIRRADSRAEVFGNRSVREIANDLLYPRRMALALFLATALTVACIAGIGVFSVVSFGLRVRQQELAIRRAIGATDLQVLSAILFGVARIYVGGVVVGWVLILGIVLAASKANIPIPPASIGALFGSAVVLGALILFAIVRPMRGTLKSDLATSMRADS